MKHFSILFIFLIILQITSYGQTDVSDAGSNSPMGGGSWLRFATGGNPTSIIENWGLNLSGANLQPVKIRNASLLVGYTSVNQDFGQGNLLVTGNVGIGTAYPQYNFDVLGNIGFKSDLFLYGDFNGGNSNNNSPKLVFEGTKTVAGASSISAPIETDYGRRGIAFSTHSDASDTRNLVERMRITYTGNVLIGKSSQQNSSYKLDVAGNIRANQITVNTSGADYVFEDGYKLKKLADIEAFISYHKHLPEIPSAAEMEKEGTNLGEMNKKLLQKVEELTLYLIEKDKQLKAQNRRLIRIEKRLKSTM